MSMIHTWINLDINEILRKFCLRAAAQFDTWLVWLSDFWFVINDNASISHESAHIWLVQRKLFF